MRRSTITVALASAALVAGCVVIPTEPMVMALPGSQKPPEVFHADDAACRSYAQAVLGGPSQAAANNAATSAAVGTAIGAAAGALIGAASGDAGAGAAIGAGTGLLFGSAAGSNYAGYSSYDLQRQFDLVYLQCMYERGNRVPYRAVYGAQPRRYAAPAYPPQGYGYPPPDYPPPAGAGAPPPGSAPAPSAPRN
jgi:hypothetical protein